MKPWLQKKLICPECLPEEHFLDLTVAEKRRDDILQGRLSCPECAREYAIENGVAALLPRKTVSVLARSNGYNSPGMLSSYLWSHFSDLLKDPAATDAYGVWSSHFRPTDGDALDIGCSVGRISLELSKTHRRVVGIDTSLPFIQSARRLLLEKRLDVDLVVEGRLTEKRSCKFEGDWLFDRVDFVVADALALPFARDAFSTVTSINILEKVPDPLGHLADMDRVLRPADATVLFSDPFSWDETVSGPDRWLGGRDHGEFAGRGIDNVRRILSGQSALFTPPLKITREGSVAWKIRKTENLWEHIISQFLVGIR